MQTHRHTASQIAAWYGFPAPRSQPAGRPARQPASQPVSQKYKVSLLFVFFEFLYLSLLIIDQTCFGRQIIICEAELGFQPLIFFFVFLYESLFIIDKNVSGHQILVCKAELY
jgi:hypothetical protein